MNDSHQRLMTLNRACGGLLVALGQAMAAEDGVTVEQVRELQRQLRQAVELCRRAIEEREREVKANQ